MNDQSSQQRIVVTGSSGLIGKPLVAALRAAGHPVTCLVRSNPGPDRALWDPATGTIDASAIEGAWGVVHLAGEGIAESKWTPEQKDRILTSRVLGTRLLSETIAGLTNKPSVLASGSAIGIYGDRGDETLDESSSKGSGYLVGVVEQWEAATKAASDAGVRVAHLRTGIVLSTKGGALKQQLLPFKLGIGGRLGSGKQFLPWISITDHLAAVRHVLETSSLHGPVNLVGPNPATNQQFTKTLGGVLKRPTLIPIPLLPLNLRYSKEMVKEVLLSSSRVLPSKLLSSGFVFTHTDLSETLRYLLDSHV